MTTPARPLRFHVGQRTLWTAHRRLHRIGLGLDAVLAGGAPPLPPLLDADGYDLRSVPADALPTLTAARPDLFAAVRQRYQRHFVRLDDADAYWRGFSGKTRSTLKRKRARWVEQAGGLDLREYHAPDDAAAFHAAAGAVSRRSYQERRLDAGLPTGPAALAEHVARAEAGRVRAFVLFHQGKPASYLHLPVDDGCAIYAHLGYDPDFASMSPGTVLQVEAFERLFADPALRLFDFTEGEGAHKSLFGREATACVDLLLLRRTWRNRALMAGLDRFDRAVAGLAGAADRYEVGPWLRRRLRG